MVNYFSGTNLWSWVKNPISMLYDYTPEHCGCSVHYLLMQLGKNSSKTSPNLYYLQDQGLKSMETALASSYTPLHLIVPLPLCLIQPKDRIIYHMITNKAHYETLTSKEVEVINDYQPDQKCQVENKKSLFQGLIKLVL